MDYFLFVGFFAINAENMYQRENYYIFIVVGASYECDINSPPTLTAVPTQKGEAISAKTERSECFTVICLSMRVLFVSLKSLKTLGVGFYTPATFPSRINTQI